ncbi:unnamed protein product [Diamesa tonsa]
MNVHGSIKERVYEGSAKTNTLKNESIYESNAPFFINGVPIDNFPYMASLRLKPTEPRRPSDSYNGFICSAVFLTREHLLTAASCVVRAGTFWSFSQLDVVAGTRLRGVEVAEMTLPIRDILVDPSYSTTFMFNNIAIIFLQAPVSPEITSIQPVMLINSTIPVGSFCNIMGWQEIPRNNGSELVTGIIRIEDRNRCPNTFLRSNHICARSDFVRPCPFDSGGPIICNGFLHGLITFMQPNHCELPREFDQYIDISVQHWWISRILNPWRIPTSSGNKMFTSIFLSFISVLFIKLLD